MINYSVVMRANPMDESAPKKAYGTFQSSQVMDINKFAEHIASHGSVFKKSDIVAVLMMTVECMREMLLNGAKVCLGDLGDFTLAISSEGATTAGEYNPEIHVKKLGINYTPGDRFENMLSDAEFNQVATRAATRALLKAVKAGETTVDLTKPLTGGTGGSTESGGSSSDSGESSGSEGSTTPDSDLDQNPFG